MTDDATHTIRVHAPLSVPKQWVVEELEGRGWVFTEDAGEAGKFTMADAVRIMDEINAKRAGLVVALDAL